MSNAKRRITSIILSLMLVMTAMPAVSANVYADETDDAGQVTSEQTETTSKKDESSEAEPASQEGTDEKVALEETKETANTTSDASTDEVQNDANETTSEADSEETKEETAKDVKSVAADFTVNPGEKTGESSTVNYGIEDWKTHVVTEYTRNLYTVNAPKSAEEITISFGDQQRIAYAYSDAEKKSYLTSCGNAADGSYANGGQSGETTAVVKAVDGVFPAYIWVQTPFDSSWQSEDLYVIKINTVDDGTTKEETKSDISNVDVQDALKKTRNKVQSQITNKYGDEWLVMGLNRDGQTVSEDYYKSVYDAVVAGEGSLETGRTTYTNNARAIIGLTSGGFDATDVGGYNLVAKLANYDAIIAQGINGPIFALLALDSHNYEIPKAQDGVTQATRENLVKYILDNTVNINKDGKNYCGWSYRSTVDEPDTDMTAMAMMALAPYKDDAAVAEKLAAAERFLKDKYIREETNAKSGMVTKPAGTYNNSNSIASVILALTSIGIDPVSFIDGGYPTMVDDLNKFLISDGGFGYSNNKTYNKTATNDGYRALVAIDRMKSGANAIYNMNDIKKLSVLGPDGKAKAEEPSKDTEKEPTVKPGDNKQSDTDTKKDTNKEKDTNKRHLRFVQGNGGKPLMSTSKNTENTENSADAKLSETDDATDNNDSTVTSADSTSSNDASVASEGTEVSEDNGAATEEPLNKALIFAGIGILLLIIALAILRKILKSEK